MKIANCGCVEKARAVKFPSGKFNVVCTSPDCDVWGDGKSHDTERDAILNWNRRMRKEFPRPVPCKHCGAMPEYQKIPGAYYIACGNDTCRPRGVLTNKEPDGIRIWNENNKPDAAAKKGGV